MGKMLSFPILLADDLRPLRLRGRSVPKAAKEPARKVTDPYGFRNNTPACRAIVQHFAAWLHYFGAPTAKHVKRWRPTFAFFPSATTHAESSIRGGNFVWKRNVQSNFLQIICGIVDSRTLPTSQLSKQNSKSYLIRADSNSQSLRGEVL